MPVCSASVLWNGEQFELQNELLVLSIYTLKKSLLFIHLCPLFIHLFTHSFIDRLIGVPREVWPPAHIYRLPLGYSDTLYSQGTGWVLSWMEILCEPHPHFQNGLMLSPSVGSGEAVPWQGCDFLSSSPVSESSLFSVPPILVLPLT